MPAQLAFFLGESLAAVCAVIVLLSPLLMAALCYSIRRDVCRAAAALEILATVVRNRKGGQITPPPFVSKSTRRHIPLSQFGR